MPHTKHTPPFPDPLSSNTALTQTPSAPTSPVSTNSIETTYQHYVVPSAPPSIASSHQDVGTTFDGGITSHLHNPHSHTHSSPPSILSDADSCVVSEEHSIASTSHTQSDHQPPVIPSNALPYAPTYSTPLSSQHGNHHTGIHTGLQNSMSLPSASLHLHSHTGSISTQSTVSGASSDVSVSSVPSTPHAQSHNPLSNADVLPYAPTYSTPLLVHPNNPTTNIHINHQSIESSSSYIATHPSLLSSTVIPTLNSLQYPPSYIHPSSSTNNSTVPQLHAGSNYHNHQILSNPLLSNIASYHDTNHFPPSLDSTGTTTSHTLLPSYVPPSIHPSYNGTQTHYTPFPLLNEPGQHGPLTFGFDPTGLYNKGGSDHSYF